MKTKKEKKQTIAGWVRAAVKRGVSDEGIVRGVAKAFPGLRDPRNSVSGYLTRRRRGEAV